MKNQELENLINRYFRGQLNDDEYRLLTEFLYDKDNLELFDKAKQQWEQNPDETENSRRNWFRLYNHIHTRKPVSKGISRRLWFRVASVAAILLVGLFLGSIVTRYISGTGFFSIKYLNNSFFINLILTHFRYSKTFFVIKIQLCL